MSERLWNSFSCQFALTLYPFTPSTPWPGSAKYGSVQHHVPSDKLSKGDNQYCTLILGEKSRSTSWGLVIRCAARCPLNMHSTLDIPLHIRPYATIGLVLLLSVSSPPNRHSHPSTSQKHLFTTSLTPPQQPGENQLRSGETRSNRGGWHREVIQSLEQIPDRDHPHLMGPTMIKCTWSWLYNLHRHAYSHISSTSLDHTSSH